MQRFPADCADFSRKLAMGPAPSPTPVMPPATGGGLTAPPPMPHPFQQITQGGFGPAARPPMGGMGGGMMPAGGARPLNQAMQPQMTPPSGTGMKAASEGAAMFL